MMSSCDVVSEARDGWQILLYESLEFYCTWGHLELVLLADIFRFMINLAWLHLYSNILPYPSYTMPCLAMP